MSEDNMNESIDDSMQMEESYSETIEYGKEHKNANLLVVRIGSEGSAPDERYVTLIDKEEGIELKNFDLNQKKKVTYNELINNYTMRDALDLLVKQVGDYQKMKPKLEDGSKSPDKYFPRIDVHEDLSVAFNTALDRYNKLLDNPKKSKMVITDKPRLATLGDYVKDNLCLLTTTVSDGVGEPEVSHAYILDLVIGVDSSGGDYLKIRR